MAIVSGVTNTVDTTSSNTAGAATTSLMDADAFMNMLITQLKYQDPLDPMETNEFMSQLAQLTQVERLQNIYDSIGDLEKTIETGNLFSAIGKKMNVEGNTLSQGDEIQITPSADYDQVVLSVANVSDGSVSEVTLNKGDSLVYTNESAGDVQVAAYAVKDGNVVDCTTSLYRVVKGVRTADSGFVLIAGNGDEYSANSIKVIKN